MIFTLPFLSVLFQKAGTENILLIPCRQEDRRFLPGLFILPDISILYHDMKAKYIANSHLSAFVLHPANAEQAPEHPPYITLSKPPL